MITKKLIGLVKIVQPPVPSVHHFCMRTVQKYGNFLFQHRRNQRERPSWQAGQPLSPDAEFTNEGCRFPGNSQTHLDRKA